MRSGAIVFLTGITPYTAAIMRFIAVVDAERTAECSTKRARA
ncbi:hypothetical protein [Glaciimonas immobilis]|uniref:Uncharacterized protein n=1 Tax=Glaciimonas immobilis TaxID=728004 RepID=A0A840RSY2_9BURK|nr:hypothetical protein [Glaciimonas immobilis]MBB5199701.1 hypothetical protein [Glaciimonas immobilis]